VTPELIVRVCRWSAFCWASIMLGATVGTAYRWVFVEDRDGSEVLFYFVCLCVSVWAVHYNNRTMANLREWSKPNA
jgi:hypothetical protein